MRARERRGAAAPRQRGASCQHRSPGAAAPCVPGRRPPEHARACVGPVLLGASLAITARDAYLAFMGQRQSTSKQEAEAGATLASSSPKGLSRSCQVSAMRLPRGCSLCLPPLGAAASAAAASSCLAAAPGPVASSGSCSAAADSAEMPGRQELRRSCGGSGPSSASIWRKFCNNHMSEPLVSISHSPRLGDCNVRGATRRHLPKGLHGCPSRQGT